MQPVSDLLWADLCQKERCALRRLHRGASHRKRAMTAHLPVFIVVVPLLAAILLPLLAFVSARLARSTALVVLAVDALCAGVALSRVLGQGAWHYRLGGWEPPWGIEYVIDPLSGALATLIAVMGFLAAIYATSHVAGWAAPRVGIFYSLFVLLVAGLQGIVVTGDIFNLYVFLEISSLAAYALLAAGGIRSTIATFRYLIIGTIAATFYLLGVGYLYAITGTLNMADLSTKVPMIVHSNAFVVAVAFLAIGLAIKAALFPLHGWLPDAYTYAPGAVSGFIASVMSKVSAYALFRILYFVLKTEGAAGQAISLLNWTALVAILAGSLLAMAQQDIRRMLAYSSVGQMGYIVLGITLGTPAALTGALLHVLNHAVMKGCLFLAAGGVQWRTGRCNIQELVGISRRMPLTMTAFAIAALSMIGLPPTAGFFSKWYLINGALDAGNMVAVVVLVASSLLSVVYFFRVFEVAFLQRPVDTEPAVEEVSLQQELPAPMLAPVLILATAILVLGFLNQRIVTHIIQFALPHLS